MDRLSRAAAVVRGVLVGIGVGWLAASMFSSSGFLGPFGANVTPFSGGIIGLGAGTITTLVLWPWRSRKARTP